MHVTILGSGTCTPRLARSASAVLVETAQAKILLDIGPGTMRRLLECGIDISALTHIFLSHFHPDHTAELVPLLFATKYSDGPTRRRTLAVLGGTGLKAFYKALQAPYGEWIVLPAQLLTVQEIDTLAGEKLVFDQFTVTARPVAHRPESLAYRIADGAGTAVVYSGDTDTCDSLVDVAQSADLFICDAAQPDDMKVPGHMTPSLAGLVAARARVKRLVLTHLYSACDDVDIVKQAGRTYKGPVTAAADLMRFVL
jgi:ribonuclease BN (tRNA processing enzyme)